MSQRLTFIHYFAGSIIWGAGIFLLGFATSLPLFFTGVLIAAIGLPLTGLTRVYLLQTLVPGEKLGRAFSFNAVLLYGSNVLSLSLFGALTAFIDMSYIFIFCGSMMVFCSVLLLLRIVSSEKSGWNPVQTPE
ncbi:MFS transporter [Bacillus luteus]|uniref:MFS transporter n=2 Tax=Alkalicoccus luteus TaxID=1237094 RepID=A0A969PS47_9BACI|nr:MFS transporter [Alkalicoccus luteus]